MKREARLTAAVLAVLLAGLFVVTTSQAVAVVHTAQPKTVELAVQGMTCAACTFPVKAALKKLDGVKDAKVSFRKKKAVVTYDPDRVSPKDMVSAIDKTGFTASPPKPTER